MDSNTVFAPFTISFFQCQIYFDATIEHEIQTYSLTLGEDPQEFQVTPAPLTTSEYDKGCGTLSVSLQGLDSTIA